MANKLKSNTKEVADKIKLEPSGKSLAEKQKTVNNIRAFVVTNDSSLHGILTFIQHEVVKEGHPMFETVAYTNGDKIFFGDLFFGLAKPFQCGILLHEMFHIVFRHVTRSNQRFHKLWNVATDALINASIGLKSDQKIRPNIPWYIDDAMCVTMGSVLDEVDAPYEIRQRSLSEWTSEQLYEMMLNQLKEQLEEEANNKQKEGDSDEDKKEGEGKGKSKKPSQGSNPGNRKNTPLGKLEKKIDELLDKLADKHQGMPGDDLKEGEEADQGQSKIGDSIWTERFNRAKAMGQGTNSILGKINPDVYKPQIPWNKELRRYLNVRCMPQQTSTMTRPGRRMLSMPKARTYLPGLEKKKGLDKMMVIIDTSGSCFNEEELTMFCSEIDSIQKTTGVEVALIFADTKIESEFIVKNDGVSLMDKMKKGIVKAAGGGGTDMVVPFIEGKKKYNPNVVVIASDGYTPFPSRSQVGTTNLIWVINTEAEVPRTAGRCLRIKQN